MGADLLLPLQLTLSGKTLYLAVDCGNDHTLIGNDRCRAHPVAQLARPEDFPGFRIQSIDTLIGRPDVNHITINYRNGKVLACPGFHFLHLPFP